MTASANLSRTAFRTSRLLDFLSEKELTAQIGHSKAAWPLVTVKELLDNALDACEEAGIQPEIEVVVDDEGIVVTDNGPGIAPAVVEAVLDFSTRVSSREAYVAPDRGAQGNALKTLLAMPFVLGGEEGGVQIISHGVGHEIQIRVDRIRQTPEIDHQQHAHNGQFVKNGTSVRLRWPNSPSSESNELSTTDDEDDLEEIDLPETDSASSILSRAKSRFLQFADDFTFLNPHLALGADWHGERMVVQATNPQHSKWRPSQPTCAHWYEPEHLERLAAAYIAHDHATGRERTVREFVTEFAGLTSSAKQRAVLDATGMARKKLADLVNNQGLDRSRIEQLLAAMRAHSKPVKPAALGIIGRDHLRARFAAIDCEMETFEYRKVCSAGDGLPWIIETAFAWCPTLERRRIITGVNWSPGIVNPFRELGAFGESLDSVLERQRAGRDEPVVLLLHIACPRVAFADRGKSSVVVED